MIDEIVMDGSSALVVPDARAVGDFLQPEREYIATVAGAINEVIARTERHEHGITYSVQIRFNCDEGWSCQACPHEHEAWQRFVRFGQTDRDCAGGHFFRVAAQDQEAIGRYVWREMKAGEELGDE